MEISDLDTLNNHVTNAMKTYGIIGGIVLILAVLAVILSFRYLTRQTERFVEESSEKTLKSFQSLIDKEQFKFQTRHQKQVDAIHEVFQKLQTMTSAINYTMKGEKFTQNMKLQESLSYVIKFRHDFKAAYMQNRLLFPVQLCNRIDALIPTVDNLIETIKSGILPEYDEEDLSEEEKGGVHIVGVWKEDAFDKTLTDLEQISKDIELEFRKIYGTHDAAS